ncbi:MAG: GWxTD domain-containing protein [Gemmatimonadota bacterium]|nr:GWxTD domain-containing protein [Gemmatimonadota bacterium]
MRLIKWYVAIVAACFWTTAYGQEDAPVYRDMPLRSKGELRVFAETAAFRGPQNLTRLEVYTLIDARQLQFVPEDGKYVSQIDFELSLQDSAGNPTVQELWTRNVSVVNIRELKQNGALVRDIIAVDIAPGPYKMTLTAEDIYGDISGACEGNMRVRRFEGTELVVSDVVFASELKKAESAGRFVKNGWHVVPNTTRFFRVGKPIQIYFEVYNFKVMPNNPNDSFVLGYSLLDTADVVVKSHPAKRLIKPGESVVKTDVLETEGLSGGAYDLQIELFDRSTREHVRHKRKVFLISDENENPQLTEAQQEQLRYFQTIHHIASEKDLGLYESLPTQDSKMKFLRTFWKKLDPTPKTPLNERLRDHINRMKYSDDTFTAQPGKRGSETDKGRVYIKYGPPSERDYTTSAAIGKAIDTWTYEKSGRYIFVFFDRRGTGVYELVHSTMSGELYNPNWQSTAF